MKNQSSNFFFSSARSSVADVSIAFTVIGLSASTRKDKARGSVVMAKTHSRVAGYNGLQPYLATCDLRIRHTVQGLVASGFAVQIVHLEIAVLAVG